MFLTLGREQEGVSPWNAAQKAARFSPSWIRMRQKECFPKSLDLFHLLIWGKASRQCLERGGAFRKNLEGDWMIE